MGADDGDADVPQGGPMAVATNLIIVQFRNKYGFISGNITARTYSIIGGHDVDTWRLDFCE